MCSDKHGKYDPIIENRHQHEDFWVLSLIKHILLTIYLCSMDYCLHTHVIS